VNKPETTELIYEFRAVMDQMQAELGSDELILMTEAYAPLDVIMGFYGNATMEGAQIPFNFELITKIKGTSNAYEYQTIITNYLNRIPFGRQPNWVMGNHDTNRVGSRLGADRIDLINILLQTLPGVSVTYQGEEIGMTDVWISWNDTVDPQACQSNPQEFERLSRDPCRTPFQWNTQNFAGFTMGNSTWLPVADNYKFVNVQRQRAITLSHLNVFKQLQALRGELVMRNGQTEIKALNQDVLAIRRSLSGSKTYITLLNVMDNVVNVNLQSAFSGLTRQMEYVIVTDKSPRRWGDQVHTDSILLMPKEAVVLTTV